MIYFLRPEFLLILLLVKKQKKCSGQSSFEEKIRNSRGCLMRRKNRKKVRPDQPENS